MARARGANAQLALGFNTGAYGGVPSAGNFVQLPFVSIDLGETQNLIQSDLLGNGRDPQTPGRDVINDEGNVTVPVDLRAFGHWLKLLFGAPVTTQGVAASGSLTFSAQPANLATITINGTAFTFKNSPSAATDIQIGATLADTVANAVIALNASTDVNVTPATYAANVDLNTINIVHDTIGTAGNTFTIVAGSTPASNATTSGATLAGGSASGAFNHVFTAGAISLPDAAIEIGLTDVPSFAMNHGVMANTLAIQLQRSGHLNAVIGLIAQGEKPRTASSAAGSLTEIEVTRFSQFAGQIVRDGVPLGDITGANINFSNGLEKVEAIREDGRISGIDSGIMSADLDVTMRFKDTALLDLASNGTPVEIRFGWKIAAGKTLSFVYHQAYLPKPKMPITGPTGVQAQYSAQGAEHPTLHKTLTVVLVNDVASYA